MWAGLEIFRLEKDNKPEIRGDLFQGVSGGGFTIAEGGVLSARPSQNIPKRGGHDPEEHAPTANFCSRNSLLCFS